MIFPLTTAPNIPTSFPALPTEDQGWLMRAPILKPTTPCLLLSPGGELVSMRKGDSTPACKGPRKAENPKRC